MSSPNTDNSAAKFDRIRRAHQSEVAEDYVEMIAELIEDGDVKVHIDKAFPLDEVAQAHELLEGGHVRGKLVLDCR